MVQQLEESCGALDVSQCFRAGNFLPLEYMPGVECPLKLPREFFQVVLDKPVQGHQITIDIV